MNFFPPLILLLSFVVFACDPSSKIKPTTIHGIYEESKAGAVVDGTLLMGQPFQEEFRGKHVEVTGDLTQDHEWKCKPYVPGKPVEQCFDGPAMKNAKITPR